MRLASLAAAILFLTALSFAADKPSIDPKTATLSEALGDWITLLEKDDLKTASTRWTSGEKSAGDLSQWWDGLKKAHATHNYRNWLGDKSPSGSPDKIGDKTSYKVGGHSYDHLHIDWQKTDSGWRIGRVWICR